MEQALDNERLRRQFEGTFGGGGEIRIVRAPGRVNLIGEHTDYNDGFVFPMAIEPEVRLLCRARDDRRVRLASALYPGQVVEFALDQPITRGEPAWANYSRGVAAQLVAEGLSLRGMDGLLGNSLPPGGGLSSSAAIEIATALSLLTLAGQSLDLSRLARLCQKAEHEYALVPCGIMDQMIVSSARAGHATLYDCRSGDKQYIPINPDQVRVLIANTMVRHELSSGEYAKRRKQCEAAVEFFRRRDAAVRSLRDVAPGQVEAATGHLDDVVLRRARHVVGENQRTLEAAAALREGRYEQAGALMVQSHASLRDDYEVSCPELDFLSEQAMRVKGVYGARMTGGGFGGCIVALIQPAAAEPLRRHLEDAYRRQYGLTPSIFITAATAGASIRP